MKKQIYYLIGTLLLTACSKDKIDTFDSTQEYLHFQNSYMDSLSYSFFYYPDSTSLIIPLEVRLIGNKTDFDREFSLDIFQEESTVSPEHYDFPGTFIFHANHVLDTIYIQINNRADLKDKEVKLSIQIKPSANFLPGQREYTYNIIRFSDIITQPSWWNEKITDNYLGKYSEKKFREFIKVTGTGDLTDLQPDEIWYLARTFKYYLASQEKAGTPVIDEDGNNMTVTVIG